MKKAKPVLLIDARIDDANDIRLVLIDLGKTVEIKFCYGEADISSAIVSHRFFRSVIETYEAHIKASHPLISEEHKTDEINRKFEQHRIQSLDAFDKQREKYEREIESIKDTHHLWGEISKRNAEIAMLEERAAVALGYEGLAHGKLGEAQKEIAALKSKLGEAEKVANQILEECPITAMSNLVVSPSRIEDILKALRTPSDGEGKLCECRPGVKGTISFDCHQHGAPFYRKEEKKPDGEGKS